MSMRTGLDYIVRQYDAVHDELRMAKPLLLD
jgi:hypothetical protein